MKIFNTIDIIARFQTYKLASVLKYIQDLLKGLDVPDVEGEQVVSISAQNTTMDGNGNMTIAVDTLEAGLLTDIQGGSIEVVVEAPSEATGIIKLYGIDNAGSIELHAIFPNEADKVIATDAA